MPLTNNVVDRVPFSLGNGSDTTSTTYARNNRFRGLPSDNFGRFGTAIGRTSLWPRT
ncbi:MAG: hypothetical protein IPM17_17260 [Verrucomicrobia bacterium]|nr:hypothetical protein [Verrucomicrobiota bacterium]